MTPTRKVFTSSFCYDQQHLVRPYLSCKHKKIILPNLKVHWYFINPSEVGGVTSARWALSASAHKSMLRALPAGSRLAAMPGVLQGLAVQRGIFVSELWLRALLLFFFFFCFWLLSAFHRNTTGHQHVRKRIFKTLMSKRYSPCVV